MHRRLTREEALRLLELEPRPGVAVDAATAKRAFRQLARTHHPDHGGDATTFHRLQLAYERLLADEPSDRRPNVGRGRPSRASSPGTTVPDAADLASVRWDLPLRGARRHLDRDTVAVWLAQPHAAPIVPLLASSRAPGSRMNRLAVHLSPDLTSRLRIVPARDDRHREVVAIEVTASARRARRALDRVPLAGGWVRTRGSSSTTLRHELVPSTVRRQTAVRVTDRLETLLTTLDWPLTSWTLTVALAGE